MSEWQPIETAPHLRPVLLWRSSNRDASTKMCIGTHLSIGWVMVEFINEYNPAPNSFIMINNATHWMELPEPPNE